MKTYIIEFGMGESSKYTVKIKARNKIEAVNQAFDKLNGWREKDSVESISITVVEGSPETSFKDYEFQINEMD